MNTKRRLLALSLTASIVGMTAAEVQAQGQENHPAVSRYNRIAKGSDVSEWTRRMSDDDFDTRYEAVDNLASKAGEDGVKPLIEAMADPDYRVRIRAIDGLGEIGSPLASPVLLQLLFLTDVNKETKLRALTALGRIGDAGTSETLLGYAQSTEDEDLSCRAIYALGEIADPSSRGGIEEIREDAGDPHVERLCTDALAKIEAKLAAVPAQQPSILELERRLVPREE